MILAVAVPFLNEGEHLPDFLGSLAAQTRTPERLLLVDDGSTDGSHEIAAEFVAAHPWAQVLRRPVRMFRPEADPELERLRREAVARFRPLLSVFAVGVTAWLALTLVALGTVVAHALVP